MDLQPVFIRESDADLIAQCQEIDRLCFPTEAALSIRKEVCSTIGHVICAVTDRKCLGYIVLRKSSLVLSICRIGVETTSRRMGIGQKLLSSALDFARKHNIGQCSLHVEEANVPAVRLYENNNFEVQGRNRDFYGISRHALRMELDFLRV